MHHILNLALVSYLIGFVFLWIIRSLDKYEKEPYIKLILLSFFGGLTAVITSWLLYLKIHPGQTFWEAIFKIGAVEEASKLISLFLLYKLFAKDFDEIVDGIIYVAAVSLGFSVIENIFYALASSTPYTLLAKRFLFATIGHISFSVYMGIAFYIHKKVHRNYSGLLWAYLLSVLGHGLYDGFIFTPSLSFMFLIVYMTLIVFQFRLLRLTYAYSKMKKTLAWSNMQLHTTQNNWTCCNCQAQNNRLFMFNSIKIYQCQNCGQAIIEKKDFIKILGYFRPKMSIKKFFLTLENELISVRNIKQDFGFYHYKKQRLNTPLPILSEWLKNKNKQDLTRYHKNFEGRIFNHLGFKYLLK